MNIFGKNLDTDIVVIAEIGVNHEGDQNKVLELLRAADRMNAKQPAGCSATAIFACICRGGLHSHSSKVVYHPAIHFCMMHVLTGMCSRRVRRMCSWHNFSSTERAWKLLLLHHEQS